MSINDIAAAMSRVSHVLQRRPGAGLQEDAPAMASWQGGTRIVASHASGVKVATDMPAEIGGSGDQVSPGWLFRAGLSSCLATCIAMNAAARGIVLNHLEVCATSRSDTRGLLGMFDASEQQVSAAPSDVEIHVRLSACGISAEALQTLVADSQRCAPVSGAVSQVTPIGLFIEVMPGDPD